jgi:hypothetical protein
MESHLTVSATPERVRRAMKRHGLGSYDLKKRCGTWWVIGGDSHLWPVTDLTTYRLSGCMVAVWIQQIMAMRDLYRKSIMEAR